LADKQALSDLSADFRGSTDSVSLY